MKRMQLSEEEERIVLDFRSKTAVNRAFNEGVITATAIARDFLVERKINVSIVNELIELTQASLRSETAKQRVK